MTPELAQRPVDKDVGWGHAAVSPPEGPYTYVSKREEEYYAEMRKALAEAKAGNVVRRDLIEVD